MAVLDYVKLYKDKGKESWAKMGTRQRVVFTSIGAAIVILFAVLVMTIGGGSGGMTPLKVPVADVDAAMRKLAIFNIKAEFSEKDSAILVDAEKETRAARILASADLLPDGNKAYGFVQESNLAQTDSARQMAYRVELQGVLGDTIAAMNSIQSAVVNLTPASRPYYYRFNKEDLRAKASVMVTTEDSKRLNENEVMSIAQLVAGSTETMSVENVFIQDTGGNHYPIAADWRQAYSVNRAIQNAQADAEHKVREVLTAYNPRVSATIAMHSGTKTTESTKFDDKEKGKVASTESRVEDTLNTKRVGTSGVEANAGRNANNDPGRGETNSSSNLEEERTKFVHSSVVTKLTDDTIKPNYTDSAIAVTISEEFDLSDEKISELKAVVSRATNIPVERVELIQVAPLTPEVQAAGMSGTWGSLMKPENITKGVLLLLALGVFITLMIMMKKSAPKPLTLVDDEFVEEEEEPLPEVPTLPPVDQLSGNLVREKVVDLIRKNPKAAANLIKRWVIIGK